MAKQLDHEYRPIGVNPAEIIAEKVTAELQAVLDGDSKNESCDYVNTWSNYSNEETFIKFLGQTSYYLCLQKNLCKIIEMIKPASILELGFGTGHTAVRIAYENSESKVDALDVRPNMLEIAENLARRVGVTNVTFLKGDMIERAKGNLENYDFIFLLYNFHHIPDVTNTDSEEKRNKYKTDFLRNCFDNMKSNSYLCIADLFLPAENNKLLLDNLFEHRIKEGHTSTFWSSLKSLKEESINVAKENAQFCERKEKDIGIKVAERRYEYPITKIWLQNQAFRQGFIKILDEDINVVGDAIMLLKKE